MVSASPTILTLDINSAWIVILVVSLVTLPVAIAFRRLIKRTGGPASGLLLLLPLALPVVAAMVFARGLLPELSVLRPAEAITRASGDLTQLFLLSDGRVVTPYAIVGRAGPWLLLIGLSVSLFMMIRRAVGWAIVRRLLARCREPRSNEEFVTEAVARLSAAAGLRKRPAVRVLPEGISGAFAIGVRNPQILVSRDLVDGLEPEELECILAHEIAHLEAKDVEMVLVAGILRDAVAWNPLAHMAYSRFGRDREREADRRAATLTGKPLDLASGLLKVCDVMKRNPASAPPALAAMRPRGRVAGRVTDLLALADGRMALAKPGRLPYIAAAMLVAVMGLQAASRLTAEGSAAVALVWGAPDSESAQVWEPARVTPGQDRGMRKATKAERLRRVDPLGAGVVFQMGHVQQWVQAVTRRAERGAGIPPDVLQWETRGGWEATPLLTGGPLPLYMMELRPLL